MNEIKIKKGTGGARRSRYRTKPKAVASRERQTDMYSATMKEIAEYVGREYSNGGDIRYTVENEKMSVVQVSDDPIDKASASEERIWERRIDEYVKRENRLVANCETVYSLMMGQCTDYMRASLEATKGYSVMKDSFDVIKLIKAIKELTYQFGGQRYHAMSLHQAKKRWYGMYQGREMMNTHFLEKFNTNVSIVEQYGGDVGIDAAAINAELVEVGVVDVGLATEVERLAAQAQAKEKYLAVAFLSASDKSRYGKLLEYLENDFTKGTKNYPKSLTSAYNLMVNYKNYHKPASRIYNDSDGVAFANVQKDKKWLTARRYDVTTVKKWGATLMSAPKTRKSRLRRMALST
jgi:hypothetical protein